MHRCDRRKGQNLMAIRWAGAASLVCLDYSWPLCVVSSLLGIGQDSSGMRVFKGEERRERGIVLGFVDCFGEKKLSYYDLLWGRGVLASVTHFGGEIAIGYRRTTGGQRALLLRPFESSSVQSIQHAKVPWFGILFSEPRKCLGTLVE